MAVGQKANILYVDDTEANLLLFEASFEKEYNIFLANSGNKGLNILRENDIAVLISDQRMPGMSGTDLLEIAANEFPHVMRFMLTAYTDYETVVESINKGQIYGFFNKPFKTREVSLALNKALEVYNLRQRNQQVLEELEKANRELLEMDQSRTLFLSSITEEIRTPIGKIMSAVHMLKDKVDASELSELLGYLDTSVSRLESFSEATKLLARLKNPQSSIKRELVSLKEVIEISTIDTRNLLDENNLHVELHENGKGLTVEGEEELLLICAEILLKNAIVHTNSGDRIIIGINSNSIDITDGGANYHPTLINQLNALFSRENPDTIDGGIELALASQIMRSHEGKISIKQTEDMQVCISMLFKGTD